MTPAQKKVAFYHQHVDKRMAVVVAGPVSNYLFAILVLAILFAFNGQPYTPAEVSSVVESSAAAKAGIKAGRPNHGHRWAGHRPVRRHQAHRRP